MYLKRVKLKNFRKFREKDNVVSFVDSRAFNNLSKTTADVNIAKTTTLIVGKNNAGKTTVISALNKLINKESAFTYSDVNFDYLKSLYDRYEKSYESGKIEYPLPCIEFEITVGVEAKSKDIISNLAPFITIGEVKKSEVHIKIRCEIIDEAIREKIQCIGKGRYDEYISLLKDVRLKCRYFDVDGDLIKGFSLDQLISIKPINANMVKDDKCLSKAFNKIVKYRVNQLHQGTNIEKILKDFNATATKNLSEEHTKGINDSVSKIESADHMKVHLRAEASFEQLLRDIVRYEFIENNQNIPENQFGLGYTNLMMIIAELIDYMEHYPEDSFNSQINLISIEEPENHMHPQMQENFIKSINEAIISLLEGKRKKVNSQLIITTHSSHILNSKIHSGNSFDYINYITSISNESRVVSLTDKVVSPTGKDAETKKKDFAFLKKHIKYKVSELFFSDAVIFVEGITEEVLLKYYIDSDPILSKKYISIFNINGAHGLVYHNLIKALRIPALIITDLDIKRSDTEKKNYENIVSLKGRETTNKTLTRYNENSDKIESIKLGSVARNMKIVFQKECQNQYPTSFEEAFILENYSNSVLDIVLKDIKKNTYKAICKSNEGVIGNSYKLQKKLSNNKSDFANALLYQFLIESNANEIPSLPNYIVEGLTWMSTKLKGGE